MTTVSLVWCECGLTDTQMLTCLMAIFQVTAGEPAGLLIMSGDWCKIFMSQAAIFDTNQGNCSVKLI